MITPEKFADNLFALILKAAKKGKEPDEYYSTKEIFREFVAKYIYAYAKKARDSTKTKLYNEFAEMLWPNKKDRPDLFKKQDKS